MQTVNQLPTPSPRQSSAEYQQCPYHNTLATELSNFKGSIEKLSNAVGRLESTVEALEKSSVSQEKFYEKIDKITDKTTSLDKQTYIIYGLLLVLGWFLGTNLPL